MLYWQQRIFLSDNFIQEVLPMSIDLAKMPKLGFGLMRLPENDGQIDIAGTDK